MKQVPHDDSSSDEENYQKIILNQPHVQQVVPSMIMPYIEGPRMDWTANDSLYYRFLKWCLKGENILQCRLAVLAERRKCKKVIAWSREIGIDSICFGILPIKRLP